jgi:hypothetical protein
MVTKGNGNGGDLGHALSPMTRLPSGEHESKPVTPEFNLQASIAPAERPSVRTTPQPTAAGPRMARPEKSAGEESTAETTAPAKPVVEEATAESSAGAPVAARRSSEDGGRTEPAVEASAPSAEPPAARQGPAAVPADATSGKDGAGKDGADGGGPGGAADREAIRDARLLRFVYVMAALTGIVAIVLYAGGWMRDGTHKRPPEESVATAPQAAKTDPVTKSEAPQTVTPAPAASDAPPIPPAPPVAPPSMTEAQPGTSDSAITTGGPAKAPADSPVPPPSAAETVAPPTSDGAVPSPVEPVEKSVAPSATQQAASPGTPAAPPKLPDAAPAAEQPATPKIVAPPVASEDAAGKTVRDVPNLRVLAPALVKPEPTQGAAPAKPSDTGVPVVTAPKVKQTAALPKVAPPKQAGTAVAGTFLIQLSSVASEKFAEREWARLRKAFPDVFGDRELVVEKKEIAGRGTFYRVQAGGFKSLDEARSVCNSLKAKKQDCLPVKR